MTVKVGHIVSLIVLFIVASTANAQLGPPGGPGGGGSAPHWDLVTEPDGTTTMIRPEYDNTILAYRLFTYIHDWKTDQWTKDGVSMGFSQPVLGNWSGGANTFTASMVSSGTIKLKMHWTGNRGDIADSIWVKVFSNANAGQHFGTMNAQNGLGDQEVFDGMQKTSEGSRLRKLSVDANGNATYTVTVSASVSHTSTSGFLSTGISASMGADPRSIFIPDNYKAVDKTETTDYEYKWWLILGTATTDGVEPNPSEQTGSLTYATAEKVKNDINYSDNVTLSASYLRGLVSNVEWTKLDTYYTYHMTSGGSKTTDTFFHASYGGESSGAEVEWKATHNDTSGDGFLTGAANGTPSLQSTIQTNGIVYGEVHSAPNHSAITREPFTQKESGTFTANFTFPDGMKADANVSFTYKTAEDIKTTGSKKTGIFGASAPAAKNYSGGYHNTDNVTISEETDLSDAVVVASVIASIAASAEGVPAPIVFSLVSAGLGGWLDSSMNSPQSISISRLRPSTSTFTGDCWKIEDDGWEAATGGALTNYQYANTCAYWSMDIYAYSDIYPSVVDRYNDSGFSNRGIDVKLDKKENGKLPGGARYYHFRDSLEGDPITP